MLVHLEDEDQEAVVDVCVMELNIEFCFHESQDISPNKNQGQIGLNCNGDFFCTKVNTGLIWKQG